MNDKKEVWVVKRAKITPFVKNESLWCQMELTPFKTHL